MSLDAADPPPDDEVVRLMLEVPYLVRRPVIRIGGETVFGFDKERIDEVLASDA